MPVTMHVSRIYLYFSLESSTEKLQNGTMTGEEEQEKTCTGVAKETEISRDGWRLVNSRKRIITAGDIFTRVSRAAERVEVGGWDGDT